MKFVRREMGDAAEASAGGGSRGMWREILVVGVSALTLVVGLYLVVGWAVALALPFISFEREERWFGALNSGSFSESLNSEQEAKLERARLVLDRLSVLPDAPPIKMSLAVLPGEEFNAFAFPGGTIGVTEGLLDLLDEEVALAFVLGHEIGHFAHRDHLRGLGRQIGHAAARAVLFGSSGGDSLSAHLNRFLDLHYSRHQEDEADDYGLRLVYESYGTVDGTERLFTSLDQNRELPLWASLLSTHPDPLERTRRLQVLAEDLKASDPKTD